MANREAGMTDMDVLRERAKLLLADTFPIVLHVYWKDAQYLAALQTKLQEPERGLSFTLTWGHTRWWARWHCHGWDAGADAIDETHARFEAVVEAAETLKKEGKWDD